jgi:hypothetical protein
MELILNVPTQTLADSLRLPMRVRKLQIIGFFFQNYGFLNLIN